MTNFLYFLAPVLGIVMRGLYWLIGNYGWSIIVFTFITRIAMFPLSLKQQKASARMSAYQPMIKDIQKKWEKDKNRQNQEIQKFYEENNIKMNFGCLPMIVNFIVLFGIIGVIQAPLDHVLGIETQQVENGIAIVQHFNPDSNITTDLYTQQSILIGEVKNNPQRFIDGAEVTTTDSDGNESTKLVQMDAESVNKIQDFNFRFMGLDMAAAPTADNWVTLIMPILSILTMVASQVIVMLTSGQQQSRTQMIVMTALFGVMFGFFAFRVPSGFSLYYTISNIVMTLQQLVLRRIYDPKKIQEEIIADIEARRAEKKAKKKVSVHDEEEGEIVVKDLSVAELNRLRLEKAREQDAKRYAEDEGDEDTRQKLDKARAMDDEKEREDEEAIAAREAAKDADAERAADEEADADDAAKPGRRMRARQNKEKAKEEQAAEQVTQAEEKPASQADAAGDDPEEKGAKTNA